MGIIGENFRFEYVGDSDYYLISEKGYYIARFHICNNCSGEDMIMLNEAHQILIEKNAIYLFDRELLKDISWDTVVRFNDESTECYLRNDRIFAFANSDGEFYDCELSKLSDYKQKLLRTIHKLDTDYITTHREDFDLMRYIAETPDFTLEHNIDDLLSYKRDSTGYTLNFSKNRSTQYKVDINRLVLVLPAKPTQSKFPTSDELAQRQIPNLHKFILDATLRNYSVTIPQKYSNPIFTRSIERLCKEKGYTYVGQVITTCAGKSDGSNSAEFADFPTAEKVSQKLIDEMDALITCAVNKSDVSNEIAFHNQYMVNSQTFIDYMNNLCETHGFRFTYNITTNIISLKLY